MSILTLSEILKGTWAIAPELAMSYMPAIAEILKGNSTQLSQSPEHKESQIESKRYVVDENGAPSSQRDLVASNKQGIGIVEINGPMVKYGNPYCYGSDELVAYARAFDNDPNIIGQIWLLDSGGGAVSAIPPYIDFLKNKKKPVIGLADQCASANLYIGVATDYLFASNTISSMFGSVGVMTTLYDYSEYLKNLGVKERLIFADQSGHKNKSYVDAVKGDDTDFKKEHLNPIAIGFQNHMKAHRPNLNTSIEGILEGKMFYAPEALDFGIIDGITNMQGAIEKIKLLWAASNYMNT